MQQHKKTAMNSNSDPLFNQYADMDFTDAKRLSEIPALTQLQADIYAESVLTEAATTEDFSVDQNEGGRFAVSSNTTTPILIMANSPQLKKMAWH